MFKNLRNEYSVKMAPLDEPDVLEDLLNKMSEDGWDLYTMHEADSPTGKPCYNCIFMREIDEDEQEGEVVDIGDFKSKMEKMFEPTDEPYQKCRQLQRKIREKQQRITKIKNLLDSTTGEKEHHKLNEEISKSLKELKELKSQLSDSIEPEKLYEKISTNKLSIILSDELVVLVNPETEAILVSETVKVRQNLAEKLGYIIPSVHFTNSDKLDANEFIIDVRGITAVKGTVYQGHRMFYPGEAGIKRKPKDAIEAQDCITKEKVFWLEEGKTKDFWEKGLSCEEVIAKALEFVSLKYVEEIFDYGDINKFIEIVGKNNLYLIENVIPEYLSIGDLRYIFTQLLKERISLKDPVYIFERLNDFADEEDKDDLLEKLRLSMSRLVCKSLADENGNIYIIEMSENIIKHFEELFLKEQETISVDLGFIEKMVKQIRQIIQSSEVTLENTALVVPVYLRQALFTILDEFVPNLSVIAKEELSKEFNVEPVGLLNL